MLCELPPLEQLNAAALARQWQVQNVKAKVETEINRLQGFLMNRRQTGAAVAVAFLCAGILVLFTDVEVGFVRWFNCGPIATESEQNSEMCR